MSRARSTLIVALSLTLGVPSLAAQGLSNSDQGALAGAAAGGATGLLFAHVACDEYPCGSGVYVLFGAGGSALFAGLGAVIGSQVGREVEGRSALYGAVLGGLLGGAAGVTLVGSTCGHDECVSAGYVALGVTGAVVLGAAGSLIGGAAGRSRTASHVLTAQIVPVVSVSSRGVLLGIRASH
jgi:hypothetical protein